MSFLSSFWNEFLTKIKENQGESSVFYFVLKNTKLEKITDDELVINCENLGIKKYLEPRIDKIEEAIYQFFKKKVKVGLVLQPTLKKNAPAPPLLSFEPTIEDVFVKAGLNKKYSFENFAVSSTNQVAYAAAQAVVNNLGSAYNPLFLYGGVGVGKTHLAQAVARKVLEIDQKKRVYFCPGDNFTNELIEAIRDKTTTRFRKKYRYLDLLIVDDIQFIAGKNHIQEEFFHTFNSIVSSGGQIILTSDRPPEAIKNLEDRLRSRFSGGLIIDIQPPDFELRTAILLIKAKEKGINLNIEAAKFIAEKITDSRALEGTLLSVYAKTLGKKDVVDLEVVDEYFANNQKQNQPKKILPGDIIKAVCSYYNIRQSHLKSNRRTESLALARQIAMYLLRQELNLKLKEIADLLKRKDHTTVLHACEKISSMLMRDQNFKKDIDNISQSLKLST
ncbi:MAG: chromosomal replication initiator protein DnaA [Microgenomates group bacterium]